MTERVLRRRARLRRKEVEEMEQRLTATLGATPFNHEEPVDRAEGPEYDVLYAGGVAVAIVLGDEVFPTLRGLLRHPPSRQHVTVDMGAVPYVYNGADIMTPGIVDADRGIQAGDLVWVRDERNHQPLAIGRATLSGPELVGKERGKGVETIHHVGDWLWKLDEE